MAGPNPNANGQTSSQIDAEALTPMSVVGSIVRKMKEDYSPDSGEAPTQFAFPLLPLADSIGPLNSGGGKKDSGSLGMGEGKPVPVRIVAPIPVPVMLSQQSQAFITSLLGPINQSVAQLLVIQQARISNKANMRSNVNKKKTSKKYSKRAKTINKGRTKTTTRGEGGAEKLLRDMFGRVLAVITPLAIVGNMLNANTSAFSVFLTSMRLVGSSMGMVLAPVFIGLSAIMYALSENIAADLIPNLENLYQNVLTGFAEAVDAATEIVNSFDDSVALATEELVRFPLGLKAWIAKITGDKPEADRLTKQLVTMDTIIAERQKKREEQSKLSPEEKRIQEEISRRTDKYLSELQAGNKDAKLDFSDLKDPKNKVKDDPNSFRSKFIEGLKLSVEELRRSTMPQAQQHSITGASRAAQMAAFNQSPFEMKMLQNMTQVINALERAAGKIGMSN